MSPDYVRQSEDRLCEPASSAFNGPFLCASLWSELPGCRDCSHSATKTRVDVDHPARTPETQFLICRCNIGEMPGKVSVKCAIAGCHYQRKMTLAEREELRRVGRENNLAVGVSCVVTGRMRVYGDGQRHAP